MSKLWVFGDSFSTDFNIKHCHQNHIDYMKHMNVDTMVYWPKILSKKLDYELINCSKAGDSNYEIFFNFCKKVGDISENDVVLIGLALIGKFMIANNSEFVNIHPHGPHNHYVIDNDTLQTIVENRKDSIWKSEIDNWVCLINEVITLKKAKVIFWSGEEQLLKNEKIDVSKCMTMSIETNNLICDSHLGILGHLTLADNFYKALINE